MSVNLHTKSLRALFTITLLLTLMAPALAPSWRLLFFAPLIVTSFYQRPYLIVLWYAFACGLILDLFLSQERFGLYALNYTLAAALLYSQKQHFFADNLSTLPIMTLLFSMLSTLVQALLMYGLERDVTLSWGWAFTDLFAMPAIDALYAFGFFILPALFFGKRSRKGSDYFMDAEA